MTALPTTNSTPSPATGEARRITELDGLRGVAILLVLFHHFTIIHGQSTFDRWLIYSGHFGWSGVELFFVLSGFLITGILLDARESPRYFRSFYGRRMLRIFPLYYVVVTTVLVLIPALFPARAASDGLVGHHDWTYWCFLSNYAIAWDNGIHNRLLAVTWSLAIEEQYYLVWPLVVLLVGKRGLLRLCPVLLVLSIALRAAMLYVWDQGLTTVYVFTPCRFDGLVVGSWIATALRAGWEARPWRNLLLATATLTLTTAYVGEWIATLYVGESLYARTAFGLLVGVSLMAIGFGSLVILLVATDALPFARRVLSSRFLRSFGKYSFAIYLTHTVVLFSFRRFLISPSNDRYTPLLTFEQVSTCPWVGQLLLYLLAIAAAWCIGWLSWHLLEKWFLNLKRYFPY